MTIMAWKFCMQSPLLSYEPVSKKTEHLDYMYHTVVPQKITNDYSLSLYIVYHNVSCNQIHFVKQSWEIHME